MFVSSINETRQYLTFKLADEVSAVDVAKVREILEFNTITKVPQTPAFMRGVINLRGSVVPVMDMRLKFGMPETGKMVDTCRAEVPAGAQHHLRHREEARRRDFGFERSWKRDDFHGEDTAGGKLRRSNALW